MTERPRLAEIDALKAVGIVTIVLIHAIRPPWDPNLSELERWLGHVTRFGVPAFLFASGFLYASAAPTPIATAWRRLRRILIPYLVASLAAHALGATEHASLQPGVILRDLALGSAFGPFYYVFVICGLVIVSPLFERLSARALAILLLASLAVQCALDVWNVWPLHLRWHIRNPGLWWSYYLAGWWLKLYGERWRALAAERRTPLLLAAAVLAGVCLTLAGGDEVAQRAQVRGSAWLGIWVVLATVWLAGIRAKGSPPWLARVSDLTYAIFLYHLFFVLPLRQAMPLPSGALAPVPLLVPWIVGCVAPALLAVLARAVLGARSRLVFGA
jgi:surface polysaccharide O-acyltransferase-like enzyme